MKLKLELFLLFIAYSYCCQNMCGGHGICGQNDKCECFIGWGASDCSERICPYGEAFIDIPLGDLDHDGKITDNAVKTEWRPNSGIAENLNFYVTSSRAHRYAECSNAGLCDRATGTCTCFPGFEGSSCQRRSCPSAVEGRTCSGHGSCLSGSAILAESEKNTYYTWDTMKYRTCVCDKGWEGVDCNLRQCIMGVDPVSGQESKEFRYDFTFTLKTGDYKGVDYYFQYKYDGISYESTDVKARDLSKYCTNNDKLDTAFASEYAEEIRRSIRLINPLSQSTVSVNCGGENTLSITIDAKYADVTKYCDSKLTVIPNNYDEKKDPTPTVQPDKTKCDANKPTQLLCSGRGLCNTNDGLCECFSGYYGAACENQLSIAI